MASDKNSVFNYLSAALPDGDGKNNHMDVRVQWRGLNKAVNVDSGYLSDMHNLSVSKLPQLIPAPGAAIVASSYANPISLHGFDDFLIVVYRDNTAIKIDYIHGASTYTGTLKASGATAADEVPRCIIQFNVYSDPSDPLSGTFTKKLLIYPDKMSMDFTITGNFTPASLDVSPNVTPSLKYACVYLSRVFGVDDDRIYASGFNDYSNWDLDTPDDASDANAWVSTAQANVRASGSFTGISVYEGVIIAFKKDFMHEVRNNKNPFRVNDVFAEGSIDHNSIQDVDGTLFFVSADGVKAYTGGNPRKISAPLDISSFASGVSGSYNGEYYLYAAADTKHYIYSYNVSNGQWGKRETTHAIKSFAANSNGFYALNANGDILKFNDAADQTVTWWFETELYTRGTLDVKRLRRIQMMFDIPTNSNVKAYALHDGEVYSANTSQLIFDSGTKTGLCVMRAGIRMTSGFVHKIRVSGNGNVKVYMMELRYAYGGGLLT